MSSFEPCAACGSYGHDAPECPIQPCSLCGKVGHVAIDCQTEYQLSIPTIEVKVTVHPTPEEQMVALLAEIKDELSQIRKMLATRIPPPW